MMASHLENWLLAVTDRLLSQENTSFTNVKHPLVSNLVIRERLWSIYIARCERNNVVKG